MLSYCSAQNKMNGYNQHKGTDLTRSQLTEGIVCGFTESYSTGEIYFAHCVCNSSFRLGPFYYTLSKRFWLFRFQDQTQFLSEREKNPHIYVTLSFRIFWNILQPKCSYSGYLRYAAMYCTTQTLTQNDIIRIRSSIFVQLIDVNILADTPKITPILV